MSLRSILHFARLLGFASVVSLWPMVEALSLPPDATAEELFEAAFEAKSAGNAAEAFELYERSAALGSPRAKYVLATNLRFRNHEESKARARSLLLEAAEAAVGVVGDQVLGQLVDEARRHATGPLAVDLAVRGGRHPGLVARAGQADIGESPLFLQPGDAGLVERALVGKHPLLPAGQEDVVELQPLGAVQGHDRHHVGGAVLDRVHHQTDVFQEPGQAVELLHRGDQFLEVLQPALRVGG